MFVGDDWYDTPKWNEMEKEFIEAGIQIIYFPYTRGISSTVISEALLHTRNWVKRRKKNG
jgi:hypothetical protein